MSPLNFMPDPRFFDSLGPIALGALAVQAGATLEAGDPDIQIISVAPLSEAGPGQVSFLADPRYAAALTASTATAIFLRSQDAPAAPAGAARLVTTRPQIAFALASTRLHRPRRLSSEQPPIHPDAELEEGVELAPGVVVGAGARIGRGAVIGANAVIGPGVCLGRGATVGAGAVIGFALIGDNVRILANAVIGEAGFGVGVGETGAMDLPQLGRVILQDGVTIGAGSCIDRGAYDDTVVGENTKIDNLCQIAHNVQIGRNCVLAAHTGISGSVKIGDGAMFGGRAGVVDHRKIGAGAKIGAASAVMSDVPAGETWSGYPARPLMRTLREAATVARLARSRRAGPKGET